VGSTVIVLACCLALMVILYLYEVYHTRFVVTKRDFVFDEPGTFTSMVFFMRDNDIDNLLLQDTEGKYLKVVFNKE